MTLGRVLRVVGAVVAGIAVAFILVIGGELFSSVVHPVPAGFEGSQEEICRHVANYPHWVLGCVVPMWGVTTLLATYLAGRLGGLVSAAMVALLLLTAVVFNVAMLPYPLWFKVVQPTVIVAAILIGCLGARRPRGGESIAAA